MSGDQKRVIIIQPGPLHLFFTTGVYYFWAMRRADTNFVFIVPEYYKESVHFQNITLLPDVLRVIYLPSIGRLKLHRFYAQVFSRLLTESPPAMILMHSCFFIDNLYLLWLCRSLKVDVFIYQTGRFAIDWKSEWHLIRQNRLSILVTNYNYLKNVKLILLVYFFISDWVGYVLDNILLPFIFLQTTFFPSINVRNGNVLSQRWLKGLNATHLCYFDTEIEAMRGIHGPFKCKKIQHPAAENARDVMSFLYGEENLISPTPFILVVPSWGFIDSMLLEGRTPGDIARDISQRWTDALERLLDAFPGRAIKLKLHPSSFEDPTLVAVTQNLKYHFGERFEVLPATAPAERFALFADVIVGDVSSVLWWCGLIGKKYVISLDIFGYPFGDIMKKYTGLVLFVSDIRKLSSITEGITHEGFSVPEFLLPLEAD